MKVHDGLEDGGEDLAGSCRAEREVSWIEGRREAGSTNRTSCTRVEVSAGSC